MKSKAFQLHISLNDSSPLIWRSIIVPEDYSFYNLHMAIQAAFGWENGHLFQFNKSGMMDDEGIGIPYEESGILLHDARSVLIKTVFKKKGNEYVYTYDFGDNWVHQIKLEAIISKELYCAVCIDGENECPPEDVGGIYGYAAMLQCFASGTKKEKKEFIDWIGLDSKETWNASYFNLREINKRLSLVAPTDFF